MKQIQSPRILQEIPKAPKTLYLRGFFPDPKHYLFLTVVGSRKYTAYGKEMCEKIIHGLQGSPIVIVSGLAKGIDSIAHHAALKAGLLCLGIPGSGLDDSVLYPKINLPLAHTIIKKGGALVSEFPPKQRAERWTFPQRNRIMAGISQATLVIESDHYSGSQITARLALEYNRDLLALPRSILDTEHQGCNLLIQEGAFPILNEQDLKSYLGLENLHKR